MSENATRADAPASPEAGPCMLSIDVEEYFHAEAVAAGGLSEGQWLSMQKRLEPCVARLLEILDDCGASATFFVLGWVARHESEVVRAIAAEGHEIASHGMGHAMLERLGQEAFAAELRDSRKLLEDIAGRAVLGYRAPTFSITHRTAWALDALAEAGYRYDSSVFPIRHDRYGVPEAPRFVHTAVGPGGGQILEIPPLTLRLMGMNVPVGGGGYLRLLPVSLVSFAVSRAVKAGKAAMLYVHPWELDPAQPVMAMSRLSRWRHRVNLDKTDGKLRALLGKFGSVSVSQCIDTLACQSVERFDYGPGDSPP